jgi:hypothetical protein
VYFIIQEQIRQKLPIPHRPTLTPADAVELVAALM